MGEIASAGTVDTAAFSLHEDALALLLQDWRANRTLWHASDLVGAAFATGHVSDQVVDAARFILDHQDSKPASRALARRIVDPTATGIEDNESTPLSGPATYLRIHKLRLSLQDDPRNAIAWTDLAREYAALGQSSQAEKAILNAVGLAPSNRFVLRSSVRFHVHQGNLDKAARLLRLADSTASDPWLVAAEIAVAGALGGKAKFVKAGRKLLADQRFRPFETSELASALATLELEYGDHRSARRLFDQALRSPTENCVAQVEWASKLMSGLELDFASFQIPRNFEAIAWDGFGKGRWTEAVRGAQQWQDDQAFSSRPVVLGSYISSVVREDYPVAERMLRRALVANPDDEALLNNLAFVYASTGRLDDADSELKKVLTPGSSEAALTATHGLVCFRRGVEEEGRALYLRAMDLAGHRSKHRALAAIYLAREELLAKTRYAKEALDRAFRESLPVKGHADIELLLERLVAASKRDPQR